MQQAQAPVPNAAPRPANPNKPGKDAVRQWSKVQAAQEITTAKTLPLRVNLPRRGAHVAFTQVLQTEVGHPMTVRFAARAASSFDLLHLGLLALGGFGALWGGVAWARRRTA